MTEEKARKIAATAAGIREDQVDVAVKAYREALCDLFNDEPEWYVALFFAGSATCVGARGPRSSSGELRQMRR